MPVIPVLGRKVEAGGAVQGPSTAAYVASEISLGYITQRPICVPHDLVTPPWLSISAVPVTAQIYFPGTAFPPFSKSRGLFDSTFF